MSAQIVLENVGVRYPNRLLFERVNWTLYDGMRVALAGRNGSGKSTLLKILAGELDPTEGKRTLVGGKRLRIGYLDQTLLDSAVLEAVEIKDKTLPPLSYIEKHLLSQEPETESSEVRWIIEKALSGLGFSKELMGSPMGQLSGGWLLRMFIGSAILAQPDVLLLDEPTNHLDLSSIQWLEEFLSKEYKGSVIIVTHDVALQKRVTDSLAILHGASFYFQTHQHDYLSFRESLTEEKRILEKQIEATQKKIDEHLDFVEKYRAKARIASRAQSKLKAAQGMEEEISELKDRLTRVRGFSYNLKFRFRQGESGSKFPISTESLDFRYRDDSPWIIHNVSFDIKRGQKVAIIGDNGAGKTTLLNLLAGRLNPVRGSVSRGFAVDVGYFGQHQLDELNLEIPVIDNLRTASQSVSLEQLRTWLGAFGFQGDNEISKKTKFLSGGERARLALLRTMLTPINVCLLDEPTNHLDIETKELLKKAISSFEGTIIFVSHDRDFVASLADRILYLSLDHTLTDYPGNLWTFFEKYPQFIRHLDGRQVNRMSLKQTPSTDEPKNRSMDSYGERKKIRNRMRSLEKKVAEVEGVIHGLGRQKELLQEKCASDQLYTKGSEEERNRILRELGEVEKQLHDKMIEWEKLFTELEGMK